MKKFMVWCRVDGKHKETIARYKIAAENLESAVSAARKLCHKNGGRLYAVLDMGEVSMEELEKMLYG